VPLILGLCAVLGSSIYILQRSGFLVPHSFDSFVQHHLDGFGVLSFGLALTGMALGLYLGRGGRRNNLLIWGTLVSVAAALAQLLVPLYYAP
jgi:hypothetical protein